MKILLISLLLSLSLPAMAVEPPVAAEFVAPPAGSQFYLNANSLNSMQEGETFEILDDRYTDVVIHARIVSLNGDVALVEIVDSRS